MIICLSRIKTVATEVRTTIVLKAEGFKTNKSPKSREDVGLPYLNKRLVPQEGNQMAKLSAHHVILVTPGSRNEPTL